MAKKGKQFKKQAALAKIRENRKQKQAVAEEESDSDLDYGRDSDDDSDDDYEEDALAKPWQQKGRKAAAPAASSDDEDASGTDDEGGRAAADGGTGGGGGRRRTADAEAVLEDYQKLTVPRRRLMRWCHEPFFERAVRDFYVRLGIGRDHKTQKACYRLCRITGVVDKSEYGFPRTEGQKPVSASSASDGVFPVCAALASVSRKPRLFLCRCPPTSGCRYLLESLPGTSR